MWTGGPPEDGQSANGLVARLGTSGPPADRRSAADWRSKTHQLGKRYASHGSQGGTPPVKVKEVYLQGQSRRYAPCAGQGGIPRAAMKEAHLL